MPHIAGHEYGGETTQEELQAKNREERQLTEEELETWDPAQASDEEYNSMRARARTALASRLYAEGKDSDEVRRNLDAFDADWDEQREGILKRRVRDRETRLIEQQRGLASGRIEGRGTQLAKKLVTESVARQSSFGKTMGGRATTYAHLAGRASDEVAFKGAQAIRQVRSQEMEQAKANYLQMEAQRERRETVEHKQQQQINMQEALASAEEESAMWASIFGVGGAAVGGVLGFVAGGPVGAVGGAGTGFAIGSKIGENI